MRGWLILGAVGCAHPSPNDPVRAPGTVPPMSLDEVQAVFDGCVACHGEIDPAADLDLRAGAACTDLVGVPATVEPSWIRLVPGHSEASYLVCKLDPDCALAEGSVRMPVGADTLGPEAVAGIAGWVDAGAPGCGSPDTVAPVFAGATAAEGLSSGIRVTWKAAHDDITDAADLRYRIYEAVTSGAQDWSMVTAETMPGRTEWVAAPLPTEETRFYVVRAVDAVGNEDRNVVEVSATTLASADESPPVFAGVSAAVPLAGGSVELAWEPALDDVTPTTELTYRAYVAAGAGAQDFGVSSAESDPGATDLLITGLDADQAYWFVVRAVDLVGNEDRNVVEVSATTLGPVRFARDLEPVLDANCTNGGCHGLRNAQEGLDLRTGVSWSALVDVPSEQCADRLLVEPGDPDASYLVDKLANRNLCSGTRMPKVAPLSDADIQLISDWISAGAADD